jgi:hypothetical protein
MGVVEVWREPNGFWRWRYIEPSPSGGDPVELYSNDVYEFSEQAGKTARAAYPGVSVLLLDRAPDAPAEREHGGGGRPRLRRGMLALLGVMVALLVLRMRRRRHAG